MRRLGLALGSGGARGLAFIPYLKALDDLGIRPCSIAGSSIGALVGALYASGNSGKDIERLAKSLTIRKWGSFIDGSLSKKHGLVKGEKVMEFLEPSLKRSFSELEIPLKIVTTDYWKKNMHVISSGKLRDAVRASISIPGIFEPKKIGRHVLIDGGVTNPVPYDLIQEGCDVVLAIDVLGKRCKRSDDGIPNAFEAIVTAFHILQRSFEEAKDAQPDLRIKPPVDDIRLLDFHKLNQMLKKVEPKMPRFKRDVKRLVG